MKTGLAVAHDRIAFLVNGGSVKRYHTVITTRDQTIAEHSFGVAWFVYWLCDGAPSVSLLMAALAHDMAEQYTGDLPAPVKRDLKIYAEVKDLEREFLRQHDAMFELNELEKTILGCADRMEGFLFCIRQRELGNINVTVAGNNFLRYLKEFEAKLGGNNLPYRTLMVHLERIWSNAQGQ